MLSLAGKCTAVCSRVLFMLYMPRRTHVPFPFSLVCYKQGTALKLDIR